MEDPGFSAAVKRGRSRARVPRERTFRRRLLRVGVGSPPKVPAARRRRSGRAFPRPALLPGVGPYLSAGRCRRSGGAAGRRPRVGGPAGLGAAHPPSGQPHVDDMFGVSFRVGSQGRAARWEEATDAEAGGSRGKSDRAPRSLNGERETAAGSTRRGGGVARGWARCGAGAGVARVRRRIGARGVRRSPADLSRTWRSGLGSGNERAALAGRGAGAELEADAEAGRAADR